ncbi:unnamed protein product [Brassicogethes aeneus]|uniref:Uncharacterized protein n=1 Tax=Brassicogethes aeneus TaxID=1431903 RepID=A0A9P0B2Y8_BRAAE|nr:unnamed protein product [Brassicogethes aeneus]
METILLKEWEQTLNTLKVMYNHLFCLNLTALIMHKKTEAEEEEGTENDVESAENLEDSDQKRGIKIKQLGGPLLAQTQISTSQQDFFKMLENRIENGPDYNSESESEQAAEAVRLNSLLKDWETASAGSRSLPATPKRRPKPPPGGRNDAVRSAEAAREAAADRQHQQPPLSHDRNYVSQISPNLIHQSYGVTQMYKPIPYNNPNYIAPGTSHQMAAYPSAMQYSAISPMYTSQPTYPTSQVRQYSGYNQHGSPIKAYVNVNSSPKHISFDQPAAYSPSHKFYGPPVQVPIAPKVPFSNGDLIQSQMYQQHQMQQYHQYKMAREQVMAQHQPYPGPAPPANYRVVRNYQSSVTIPIVKTPQQEMNSHSRKQYELT